MSTRRLAALVVWPEGKKIASNALAQAPKMEQMATGAGRARDFSFGYAFTFDGSALYLRGLRTLVKVGQ